MIHNKCPPSTTILSLSNISRLLFYYTVWCLFWCAAPPPSAMNDKCLCSTKYTSLQNVQAMYYCSQCSAMNDKCLHSLFTLLHNVRMARLTQPNPATKGPRLLSHQENIHCAPPRDPQTRSNPRCCSLELLCGCRAIPSGELLHMGIGGIGGIGHWA